MSQIVTNTIQKKLSCDRLPLAIYREIVAHLRQVEGVKADLLPQTVQTFDYLQSQVGGLILQYPANPDTEVKVNAILAYYATKYGEWEIVTS